MVIKMEMVMINVLPNAYGNKRCTENNRIQLQTVPITTIPYEKLYISTFLADF